MFIAKLFHGTSLNFCGPAEGYKRVDDSTLKGLLLKLGVPIGPPGNETVEEFFEKYGAFVPVNSQPSPMVWRITYGEGGAE